MINWHIWIVFNQNQLKKKKNKDNLLKKGERKFSLFLYTYRKQKTIR